MSPLFRRLTLGHVAPAALTPDLRRRRIDRAAQAETLGRAGLSAVVFISLECLWMQERRRTGEEILSVLPARQQLRALCHGSSVLRTAVRA